MYDCFIAEPSITSLAAISDGSLFTLNCTSIGSPATDVTWRKDGRILSASSVYGISQILYSGRTSTYFNLLEVDAGPYAVTGDYSCEVSNLLGSDSRDANFGGSQHYSRVLIYRGRDPGAESTLLLHVNRPMSL